MTTTPTIRPEGEKVATERSSRAERLASAKLRSLEERLAHEIMDAEERCELRDRILRLRRKLRSLGI
jgi:hypothetical protein